MLQFPNTRVAESFERPLLAGAAISAEGCALVAGYIAGQFGVQPSQGTTGEIFVGVALSRTITPTAVPAIEDLTVTSSGIVPLRAIPTAGTLRVVDSLANVAYTIQAGAPTAAGQVQFITGTQQLVFDTTETGKAVAVFYVRSLTVAQAIALVGNQDIGGPAGAYFGQVGVITRGDIYTSEFDTTVDWTTAGTAALKTEANGKFTLGGSGGDVPGYVISIPSDTTQPFLGIHIGSN
jgi:hypothetical protein